MLAAITHLRQYNNEHRAQARHTDDEAQLLTCSE